MNWNRFILFLLMQGTVFSLYAGILPDFKNSRKPKAHNPPEMQADMPAFLDLEVPDEPLVPIVEAPKEVVAIQKAISKDAQMLVDHPIAKKYAGLVEKSEGKFYSSLERPLLETVSNVLSEQLEENADVVFLIDHTSSMEDDIEEVRSGMTTIMEGLSKKKGVRAGIVTFSDVKSGSRFGYCARGLSNDFMGMADFLAKIELLGSVEDVYGAIWKTVDEFAWESKNKRLIVIISDEKPACCEESDFSEEDVIAKCAKHNIDTNLYPILVDKYKSARK